MSKPSNLVELFERNLAQPDRPFIVGVDGLNSYCYGQAWHAAGGLATAFAARNVAQGDRVAVQMTKTSESLLIALACFRMGAVLVALNPGATAAELEYLLADAQPTLVIDDSNRDQLLSEAETATPFEPSTIKPHDLAAMVYTSGTTGKPKGAMITHANLTSNALTLAQAWGFTRHDRLLHALPIFHVHGLFVAAHTAIAGGATLVLAPKFDLNMMIDQLPHATVLMGVPTFYTRLLDDPRFDRDLCANIRLFVSGSAPLLASIHEEFEARTGHVILERYGMTETSMLTSNPLRGERKAGTVGPALAGVNVRVVTDADGCPLAQGEIGAIEVAGPNVFPGYWQRPELTASEFRDDGYFRTGDIGVFDADGYLTIVGRAKDLIISGGFNVYPKEIEEAIDAHDNVLESAVIGIPNRDFGEAVVAVVVASGVLDPELLRQQLKTTLASYKVPKRIVIVDALPRNALGKVEKARLRIEFQQSE